jgi:hypothetical protein
VKFELFPYILGGCHNNDILFIFDIPDAEKCCGTMRQSWVRGPQLYKLEQQLTRGKSTANPTQTVDGNVV